MLCSKCGESFRLSDEKKAWAKVHVQLTEIEYDKDSGDPKPVGVVQKRGYYCGDCVPDVLINDSDDYEDSVIA